MIESPYSNLGFNDSMQTTEFPIEFPTAFDIDQENRDFWEREGDLM